MAIRTFTEHTLFFAPRKATLENVLVPLYLAHRYQVEAATKMVGGVIYNYAVRGDGQVVTKVVSPAGQKDALSAILETLQPQSLSLPENILQLIPPQPMGYSRDRELFKVHTGLTFDPVGAAEAYTNATLNFLLHPAKMARVIEHHARDGQQMSMQDLIAGIQSSLESAQSGTPLEKEIERNNEKLFIRKLLELAANKKGNQQVSAIALGHILAVEDWLQSDNARTEDSGEAAHRQYLSMQIEMFKNDPEDFEPPVSPTLPDGSPIGCGY